MKITSFLAPGFSIALMVAAATTLSAEPAPSPDPSTESYLAIGAEPFWSIEITPARLTYHDANRRTVRVANPGARPSFNGERYITRPLTVDITHSACSDGMSDRRYRDTVMVEVNGHIRRGCGGPRLSDAALEGTDWRIVSLNGVRPRNDQSAELHFSEGRLTGTIGCNRLSGSAASDGSRLNVGPVATTRMACDANIMAQESQLLALLRRSLSVRTNRDGTTALTDGTSVLLLSPLR